MRDTLSNVVLHNSGYDKGLVLVDNDSLKTGKGGGQSVYTQTDILLFELQAVMSGIDEINAANDPTLESKKERASMAAMIGGGTPAMVGGPWCYSTK